MLTRAEEEAAALAIRRWLEAKRDGTDAVLSVRRQLRRDARAAEDLLVRSHLRLVPSIARHYRKPWIEFDDLVAEGNYALARAARDFPAKGRDRFGPFAKGRVRAAIGRFADLHGHAASVPERHLRRARQLERLKREEFRDEPYKPVDRVTAEPGAARSKLMWLLDVTDSELADLERLNHLSVSLSTPIGQGLLTLGDTLYYGSEQEFLRQEAEDSLSREFVHARVAAVLPLAQMDCLAAYFGLRGEEAISPAHVAKNKGVSETTVRVRLRSGIERLGTDRALHEFVDELSQRRRSTAADDVASWHVSGPAFA